MQPGPDGTAPVTALAELKPIFPVMAYPTFLKEEEGGVLTSYDTSKPEGQLALYAARMAETFKIGDAINTVIEVVHMTVHPAQSTREETGEVDDWLRVVLQLKDGSLIAAGSRGVLKSLVAFCQCFKVKPPFDPPVPFQVKQTNMGKNRWFTLIPVLNGQK